VVHHITVNKQTLFHSSIEFLCIYLACPEVIKVSFLLSLFFNPSFQFRVKNTMDEKPMSGHVVLFFTHFLWYDEKKEIKKKI
jgi:hypothetical protein